MKCAVLYCEQPFKSYVFLSCSLLDIIFWGGCDIEQPLGDIPQNKHSAADTW